MKKSFYMVISLLLLVHVGSIIFLGKQARNNVQSQIKLDMEQQSNQLIRLFKKRNHDMMNDILFLSSTPPTSGIIRASNVDQIDQLENTPIHIWKKRLQIIFVGFVEHHTHYAQLRYIRSDGQELVRVDREGVGVHAVQGSGLQNKKEEPYFSPALNTPPGEVYISDISLNKEYGVVEYPFWPTYRVSSPILDEKQEVFGFVIGNIFAKPFLDEMKNNVKNGYILFATTSSGEFVIHPDQEKEFARQTGKSNTWSTEFKKLPSRNGFDRYQRVIDTSNGRIYLLKETPVLYSRPDENRVLNLIITIPEKDIDTSIKNRQLDYLISVLLIFFISAIIIALLYSFSQKQFTLSQIREEFESLFNSSIDAILMLDKNGCITKSNLSASDTLGFSPGTINGRNFLDFIPQEHGDELNVNIIQEVYNGKLFPPFHVKLHSKHQKTLEIAVTLSPIKSQIQITGIAAIIRDITRQKMNENKIQTLNKSLESQIKSRTKELEIAHKNALIASSAKSAFVANISHEIRTPLNGILGMLRLLKGTEISTEQRRYLTMAETSANTLMSLVNDVLDLSKIESGKMDLEEIEFDMVELLSDVALSMALSIEQKDLELVLDIADIEQQYVVGDSNKIMQIITNLIGNAMKFTDVGGVTLSAKTTKDMEGYVTFSCRVTDTGIGIAADRIDSIFSNFAQEDISTTRLYGGTGLGLSICKKLCVAMNGDMFVTSEKGKGSTFAFDIPLKFNRFDDDSRSSLDLSGKNVALIEGNSACLLALRKMFEAWGATVYTASDGFTFHQLVEEAQEVSFAIIACSLRLRDIEGVALLEEASKIWGEAYIPLLFVPQIYSSHVDPGEHMNVITKPVAPGEVLNVLCRKYGLPTRGPAPGSVKHRPRRIELGDIDFSDYNVLIVDDNRINREVLKGMLKPFGLKVSFAVNGEESIQALLNTVIESPISLIFMDCHMPVMDGYEATQKIRAGEAGEHYANIPIIATTANAMAEEKQHCLQQGMNDYMAKPIKQEQLEQCLAQWLSDESPAPKTELIAKDGSAPCLPGSGNIWNKKHALANSSGDINLLNELIQIFLDDTPNQIKRLQASIQECDLEAAYNLAHTICGAAGTIGGVILSERCRELCTQLRDQQCTDETLDQALAAVIQAYDELMKVLR